MKKISKKLSLKKKTISQLTNEQMYQVRGGAKIIEIGPADPLTKGCVTQTCRTFCPDAQGNHC